MRERQLVAPMNNPGVQVREISIGLLTQRTFHEFCEANIYPVK